MQLTLSEEQKAKAVRSIQQFLEEQLDQDMGELMALLTLEFFTKELAPLAYNKGVQDAADFIISRREDLEATCFEEPFAYWNKR